MTAYFLCLLGLVGAQDSSNDKIEELKAIRTIFDENRNKFDRGNFRFSYVRFRDCNLDDVKQAHFKNSNKCTGEYIFNGQFAKYVRLLPDDVLTSNVTEIGAGKVGTDLISFRAVTDKRRAMKDLHIAPAKTHTEHKLTISSNLASFYQDIIFPLELGFADEYRRDIAMTIEAIIEGRQGIQLVSIGHDAILGNRKVTRIEIEKGGFATAFYVDLERGCIPLQTQRENKRRKTFTELLGDVRLVPGHGWLPFSSTYFYDGRGEHVEITSYDLEIPRDVSQLEFARPEIASDMDAKHYYPARVKWDLANLPSSKDSTAFGTPGDAGEPTMPGELERPPRGHFVYYILGAIILALLYIVGRIRRSAR
jgi:hypothetical protein